MPGFKGTYQTEVKFTRVPDGGYDIVQVNGLFSMVSSGEIEILAHQWTQ